MNSTNVENYLSLAYPTTGYVDIVRIPDWHLATGLPLSASGVVVADVVTGTTFRAGRFKATATTTDMLCATVPLGNVLKVYNAVDGSYPEVVLKCFAAQGGSGTASATLTVQADVVWQYGASSFTDTNIADANTTLLGTTDDVRKSLEFNLVGAASASDKALITANTVLNIKLHPNEGVATNQFANVWGAFLEIRRHVRVPD